MIATNRLKAIRGLQEIAEDTVTTASITSVTSAFSCSISLVAAEGRAAYFEDALRAETGFWVAELYLNAYTGSKWSCASAPKKSSAPREEANSLVVRMTRQTRFPGRCSRTPDFAVGVLGTLQHDAPIVGGQHLCELAVVFHRNHEQFVDHSH